MASISPALQITLKFEGGYANNPKDPGGITMYGITARTAALYGYKGDMRLIPMDLVIHIYTIGYWNLLSLDYIKSQDIANNVFDCGVNMGVGISAKMLQKSVNAQNKTQLDIDGNIGSATITDINALNSDSIVHTFQTLRLARYQLLVQYNHNLSEFLSDWTRRATLHYV